MRTKKQLWNKIKLGANDFIKSIGGWGNFTWRIFFNIVIAYYIAQFLRLFTTFLFESMNGDFTKIGNILINCAVFIFFMLRVITVDDKEENNQGVK